MQGVPNLPPPPCTADSIYALELNSQVVVLPLPALAGSLTHCDEAAQAQQPPRHSGAAEEKRTAQRAEPRRVHEPQWPIR